MESDDGFRSFSKAIKSDPLDVRLAKWRRDAFIGKLNRLPDVVEVIESGSLARGTQIGPVHDVDLIVVFDSSCYPDYGIKDKSESARESAQTAMTYLETELGHQLHPWLGAREGMLKETEQRTHVVTCYADWAVVLADIIPMAPPVDVMPAVREGSHLLVPERGTGWIDVDPEWLIRQVAQRQREWKYFTEVVGMVKAWAEHEKLGMKNLAVEIMVLRYCPRPGFFETLSCGEAVARFFDAAYKAHIRSLKDPAGRSGEIDPKTGYSKLRTALENAAGLAQKAMDAEHAWKNRRHAVKDVTHPDEIWRELFGSDFPRPRKRFWRAPATEVWAELHTVEFAATTNLGENPVWSGGGPKGPDHRGPNGPGDLGPNGPSGPGGSGPGGGPGPSGPGSGSRRRPRPAAAGSATSYWTGVFASAGSAVSVPLTFG